MAPKAISRPGHGPRATLAYNPGSLTLSRATLNPQLRRLQPYPFERLRALFASVTPNPARQPINLSLGEPKHPTPALVLDALASGAKGLANYPTTAGAPALREAIAAWLRRRHGLRALDAQTQVLPVLGSREALFAFAQTVIDPSRVGATVVVPNPFYQIYEGAALLAGATPYCVNSLAANGYAPQWDAVPGDDLERGPSSLRLFAGQPDRAGDEPRRMAARCSSCRTATASSSPPTSATRKSTSTRRCPPLGSLAAAQALGRDGYPRLLAFGSLSKRSNAPGLRSGYVAGDAA